MPDVPVKAVKKALDLLSMLIFDDPELKGINLTRLAKQAGLPVNTTHNLLKTLSACGYVTQNEAGRYQPGPQCRRIGLLNKCEGESFKEKLIDVIRRYTAQINEAIVFAVLHGGKRVVLASSEPVNQGIRIDRQVVEQHKIYCLPTGRVLVAFSSPEDVKRIQIHYGDPHGEWPSMAKDVIRIRDERRCQMLPDSCGVNSFAVPVMDKEKHLLGALGCYAPPFRSGTPKQKQILAALRAASAELSPP